MGARNLAPLNKNALLPYNNGMRWPLLFILFIPAAHALKWDFGLMRSKDKSQRLEHLFLKITSGPFVRIEGSFTRPGWDLYYENKKITPPKAKEQSFTLDVPVKGLQQKVTFIAKDLSRKIDSEELLIKLESYGRGWLVKGTRPATLAKKIKGLQVKVIPVLFIKLEGRHTDEKKELTLEGNPIKTFDKFRLSFTHELDLTGPQIPIRFQEGKKEEQKQELILVKVIPPLDLRKKNE